MNIYEALKSGKRYRRPPGKKYDPNFWYPALCPSYVADQTIRTMYTFEDMLADDWEIEETSVTINESDFESAIQRTTQSFSMYNPPHISEFLARLKKELGL